MSSRTKTDTLSARRTALLEALTYTPQCESQLCDFGSVPKGMEDNPNHQHRMCIEGVMCKVFHDRTGKGGWVQPISWQENGGFTLRPDDEFPEVNNEEAPGEVYQYFGLDPSRRGKETIEFISPFDQNQADILGMIVNDEVDTAASLLEANDAGATFAVLGKYLAKKWRLGKQWASLQPS